MRSSTRTNPAGLTLFEMMIALGICATVATLAVPGLRTLVNDAGRVTAVNSFVHALMLARSEAITHGGVVSLCKSGDGSHCMNKAPDWNVGWIIFRNLDRDDPPSRGPNEPVIGVYAGWPGGHITSNREAYSFRPVAQNVINGTVIFCDPRGSSSARALIINNVGRPRLSQRDSRNKPLRCPAG